MREARWARRSKGQRAAATTYSTASFPFSLCAVSREAVTGAPSVEQAAVRVRRIRRRGYLSWRAACRAGGKPPDTPFSKEALAAFARAELLRGTEPEEVFRWFARWNRQRTRPAPKWTLEILIGKQDSALIDEEMHNEVDAGEQRDRLVGVSHRPPPTGEETSHFFKVANGLFDWHFEMPPVFKLVWICLQRHANGRMRRLVRKVSHDQIALECGIATRVVAVAIRYLAYVGAIHIVQAGGARRRGKRLTAVYHVPPVMALNVLRLTRMISRVPARLRRMRPDTS